MAHYAWINADNVVINVSVGVDETVIQQGVGGSTEAWEQFYTNAINQDGVYVKRTSFNTYRNKDGVSLHKLNGTPFRGKYAGIGNVWNGTEFVEQ